MEHLATLSPPTQCQESPPNNVMADMSINFGDGNRTAPGRELLYLHHQQKTVFFVCITLLFPYSTQTTATEEVLFF